VGIRRVGADAVDVAGAGGVDRLGDDGDDVDGRLVLGLGLGAAPAVVVVAAAVDVLVLAAAVVAVLEAGVLLRASCLVADCVRLVDAAAVRVRVGLAHRSAGQAAALAGLAAPSAAATVLNGLASATTAA